MADAKIGTLSIDKAYIGTGEVTKMYLGETEVWSAQSPTYSVTIDTWTISGATSDADYFYSTDNGTTWVEIEFEFTGVLVENVTQIRFKVNNPQSGQGWIKISGVTYLTYGYSDTTVVGDNVILTGNILVDIWDTDD